jgi:hypothetical protein
MSDIDAELGPVDYVVVALPVGQADFSGEMASELAALMDSNTVRVLDLLLARRSWPRSTPTAPPQRKEPDMPALVCMTLRPTIGCGVAHRHHPGITRGRVNLAAPARGEGAASQVTWG